MLYLPSGWCRFVAQAVVFDHKAASYPSLVDKPDDLVVDEG
jgi:hypothetical protein